jgi:Flp pilus assembly pilin Flp
MNKQSGQAAVEYILLTAVIIAVVTVLMGNVRDFLLIGGASCVGGNSNSLACLPQKALSPGFKYFTLRR